MALGKSGKLWVSSIVLLAAVMSGAATVARAEGSAGYDTRALTANSDDPEQAPEPAPGTKLKRGKAQLWRKTHPVAHHHEDPIDEKVNAMQEDYSNGRKAVAPPPPAVPVAPNVSEMPREHSAGYVLSPDEQDKQLADHWKKNPPAVRLDTGTDQKSAPREHSKEMSDLVAPVPQGKAAASALSANNQNAMSPEERQKWKDYYKGLERDQALKVVQIEKVRGGHEGNGEDVVHITPGSNPAMEGYLESALGMSLKRFIALKKEQRKALVDRVFPKDPKSESNSASDLPFTLSAIEKFAKFVESQKRKDPQGTAIVDRDPKRKMSDSIGKAREGNFSHSTSASDDYSPNTH